MDAGLVRIGRWLLGAGLAMAVLCAHAQRLHAPSGYVPHATMSRAIYSGGGRFDGLRANFGGEGWRAYAAPMHVQGPSRFDASPSPLRRVDARDVGYVGAITPVSAQTRPAQHPPADSPVRAGSIREDVARYNEERAAFRPFARDNADVPRPPMPSPYRN
jgi:hypothetical protein